MFATLAVSTAPLRAPATRPLRHRGFTLEVRPVRRDAADWGYAVLHEGYLLHAERSGYRTPGAAERAARGLVDDALSSYHRAAREAGA